MQDRDGGSEIIADNATTGKSNLRTQGRGVLLYFVLVAAQTVGGTILLMNMLPLYRTLVLDFSNFKPGLNVWWPFVGILIIQVSYWLRVHLQPPLPQREFTVLGHVILFFARLMFVCATGGFTVMFLNRFEDLRNIDYPPARALVVLMLFFSLFCWMLELERLGKALQQGKL